MKFTLSAFLLLAAVATAESVLDYSDGIPLCCSNTDKIEEAGDDVIQQVTSAFVGAGGGAWDLGDRVAGECIPAFPTDWSYERENCTDGLKPVYCKKHAHWTLTLNGTSVSRNVHGQCHL
ncbi:uncharacterized protein BO66DRAFT_437363 [Aspergillus aculeatinus CBS 121060]|uniref:Uncharacterized protein n=1 Tax=Aspergillus aculeatinus CBS 121060 TaxID=1448322 RepID=A0ACD1HD28_9EURO|nr:hypothetical protein BO66DRAFT_437363 [Aspergillus aculeatinus CBS 121060]RAH71339.1 hypothetical protein BO66DRAFT_437363 [Aspergillus aculeatinus CBS 121060]